MAKVRLSERITKKKNFFLSISERKYLRHVSKVQIKSEKLTPFGGILSVMEQFNSIIGSAIDSTLGLRCKLCGYQYSEIIRSLGADENFRGTLRT